jgi:FlaA1/EpsC-like NDP-sugar epimerase
MYNLNYYGQFENKIIANTNRFKLKNQQIKQIANKFLGSNVLVIGAAGSIGSMFTMELLKYKFNKIYLIDKDENQLTELNRELILKDKKKIIKFEFICNDLNLLDIHKFIFEKKINHYLNFAAIKHVRSEENLISAKYMLQTNSFNFIPKKIGKLKSLKTFFSISTDKAVNPSSLLGISKRIMELNLMKIKKEKPSLFVSTTRFANVSFSNGSILKLIVDRLAYKKNFGIPKNISRYFITHEEAVSLCLKSLLKENDGHIIIPNQKILGEQLSIEKLLCKILKFLRIRFLKKKNGLIKTSNSCNISLKLNKIIGQKQNEELSFNGEVLSEMNMDKSVFKIKLDINKFSKIDKDLKKINKNNFLRLSKSNVLKKYTTNNKGDKISYQL